MGFFNTEVELIIPPKKHNERASATRRTDKAIKVKSLNGYDAIREKIDEDARDSCASPLTVKKPVVTEKPKTKVSIGL